MKKYQNFLSENCQFLGGKIFSIFAQTCFFLMLSKIVADDILNFSFLIFQRKIKDNILC